MRSTSGPDLNITLRGGGALLLSLAAIGARLLLAHANSPGRLFPSPVDWLLALVIFAAATSGTAALVLGAHLLDRVAIARPWLPTGGPDAAAPRETGRGAGSRFAKVSTRDQRS